MSIKDQSYIKLKKTIKKLSPKIKKALFELYGDVMPDIKNYWKQQFSPKKVEERINLLLSKTNIKFSDKLSSLEIGSGLGFTMYWLSRYKVRAFGIEPNKKIINLAKNIYGNEVKNKKIFFVNGIGEKLPFSNNIFDLVMSYQVIEHVQNPKKVIKESYRILKKGGIMYHVIPNYQSFWEGHYGIFWLPNLLTNTYISKIYVRLFCPKKDPNFLSTLNNITPQYVRQILKELPKSEVITMGDDIFLERITSNYIPKWGKTNHLTFLKNLIRFFNLDRLIGNFFVKMNWYYPIVLILKKGY